VCVPDWDILQKGEKMETKNIFIRDIPKDEWAKYKYLADLNGTTAAEGIRRHIKTATKEEEKGEFAWGTEDSTTSYR